MMTTPATINSKKAAKDRHREPEPKNAGVFGVITISGYKGNRGVGVIYVEHARRCTKDTEARVAFVRFDCCQIDEGARVRKERSFSVDGNIASRRRF